MMTTDKNGLLRYCSYSGQLAHRVAVLDGSVLFICFLNVLCRTCSEHQSSSPLNQDGLVKSTCRLFLL